MGNEEITISARVRGAGTHPVPVEVVDKIGDWRGHPGPVKPGGSALLRAEIRNIGGVPARDVAVKLYARAAATGKRSLVSQTVFSEIGNGTVDIAEEQVESPYERENDRQAGPSP